MRNFEVTSTIAPSLSLRKRDILPGAVKAWTADGAGIKATATPRLDGSCAHCPAQPAGRNQGTVSRQEESNCTNEEGVTT
jgi:hypothetical protein